jgi:hypothetical protein
MRISDIASHKNRNALTPAHAVRHAIDICINNGIIGVQEGNAYAETKGKR